jgi:hypothetical protein
MISSIFLARSVMGFIEEELLYDKRRNWPFIKAPCGFDSYEVMMIFIEDEIFHNKRRNLTVYEKFPFDLLARSRCDIHWMGTFPW